MKWTWIFIFFFSTLAWAQRPLVLAPGASPEKYQQYLNSHSSMISVTDFLTQNSKTNDEKIFSLADSLEQAPEQLLSQIEKLRQESIFSENAAFFLRDLLEKLNTRSFSAEQIKRYQELVCFNESLLHSSLMKPCLIQKMASKELQKRFPWADALVIEGRSFKLQGSSNLELNGPSIYHFQIVSNTHKTLTFYGSLSQLLQQSFSPDTWVSGVCDEFSVNVEEFSIREQGLAFFNSECLAELRNPRQKASMAKWMENNRHWVYAAGALVVGGLVYSMRNKTVVVDTSGFK
ncbi:hypothetical protein [Bdellovibrio sp. HCB2-146]|uniref:hypothetical protein n=1 Tax=Bdellovibrio sp. HCB2-146 TaxID=3394362 RepID=UPI0039BD599C